jgi:hypothetical protein
MTVKDIDHLSAKEKSRIVSPMSNSPVNLALPLTRPPHLAFCPLRLTLSGESFLAASPRRREYGDSKKGVLEEQSPRRPLHLW